MFAIWYAALAIEELRKTLLGLRKTGKRRTCGNAPCLCNDNPSAVPYQASQAEANLQMASNVYNPTTSRNQSEVFEPSIKPTDFQPVEKKVIMPNAVKVTPTNENETRPRRSGGGGSSGTRSEENSEIITRAQIDLNKSPSKPKACKQSAFEKALAASDTESECQSMSSSNEDESYRKTASQMESHKSKTKVPGKQSQVVLPASILGSLADTNSSEQRNQRDFMEEKEERKRENVEYEREVMDRHRKSTERRNQKLYQQ